MAAEGAMSDSDTLFGRKLVWAGVGAAVFVSGAFLAIATRAGGGPILGRSCPSVAARDG
jgi:hypothetical protein